MRALDLPRFVDETAREFGLRGPEAQQALSQSASVTARYTGPFLVPPAMEMGRVFSEKVAADPGTVGFLLYRGGKALEKLMLPCLPDAVAKKLRPLAVSRVMIEGALRDWERQTNTVIGSPEVRYTRKSLKDSFIDGSHNPVTDYLWAQGVFEREVDLYDICHHATLTNLLSLLGVQANTHLVFYETSTRDPDPSSKRGYLVNHKRLNMLFGDPALNTMLNREETMRAVEDTLNGPYSSAERIVDGAPEQRLEAPLHRSIDPATLDPAWRDEEVRIAAKALNLRVLAELGEAVADEQRSWPRPRPDGWIPYEIAVGYRGFLGQMRALLTNDPRLDPAFGAVMRTVVRPTKPEKAYHPPVRHRGPEAVPDSLPRWAGTRASGFSPTQRRMAAGLRQR